MKSSPLVLFIATGNQGKCAEISAMLTTAGIGEYVQVINMKDQRFAGLELPDPVEDGDSYVANCRIKVRAWIEFLQVRPELEVNLVLAEDSGLNVDALPNVMGVHSARLCDGTDHDRNIRLLELMTDKQNRAACYMCHMELHSLNGGRLVGAAGSLPVTIMNEMDSSEGGFGYDRVTALNRPGHRYDGWALSRIPDEEMRALKSHRQVPLAAIVAAIRAMVNHH